MVALSAVVACHPVVMKIKHQTKMSAAAAAIRATVVVTKLSANSS